MFASAKTLGRLARGQEAALRIETVVREDSISLFGFYDAWEKEWFATLTKVQGVGAKVCLSILSVLSPSQLSQAVAAQDKTSFTRANGVGPKLAARIVTELKDKIVTIPMSAETNDFAKGMDMDANEETAAYEDRLEARAEDPNLMEDAISALVNLGYQRLEAYRAVSKAMAEGQAEDVSSLIRLALKEFANKEERLVSPQKQPEDEQGLNAPVNLRPNSLADFVGQKQVCENLKVFIEAAKKRGEALDHVLLFGPPGLGKTTLASIVAKELGVGFRATSAPMISKSGDLAAILTNLERNDVLFIDEIHRLNPAIEEVLYSAMEDFQLDLIIGEGPSARSVRIDLQPFTLVGATTRSGMLSTPLRERFGIPLRLDFYSPEELEKIVTRGANLLGMPLSKEGAMEIAKRSRGTPRVAGRLLRRVRDFGAVAEAGEVDNKMADKALRRLDVDNYGLDAFDRRYLQCIVTNYGGGPVGADTLAAALSEERDTIEEVVEPFLLKLGFLQRTPRGRVISDLGCEYLGIAKLRKNMRFAQNDLFDDLGDKD